MKSSQKKSGQDKIRSALRRLIDEHGVDMATVSRAIGKNHAYIQQYMTRGIPAELSYKTAMALAHYFGTDMNVFGMPGGGAANTVIRASNDGRHGRHPVETIRRMMGLTPAQFAAALKSDVKVIDGIEKGRMALTETLLFKICQTFHVEPEDLREFVPQFSDEERQVIFQLRQMNPQERRNFESMLKSTRAQGVE